MDHRQHLGPMTPRGVNRGASTNIVDVPALTKTLSNEKPISSRCYGAPFSWCSWFCRSRRSCGRSLCFRPLWTMMLDAVDGRTFSTNMKGIFRIRIPCPLVPMNGYCVSNSPHSWLILCELLLRSHAESKSCRWQPLFIVA